LSQMSQIHARRNSRERRYGNFLKKFLLFELVRKEEILSTIFRIVAPCWSFPRTFHVKSNSGKVFGYFEGCVTQTLRFAMGSEKVGNGITKPLWLDSRMKFVYAFISFVRLLIADSFFSLNNRTATVNGIIISMDNISLLRFGLCFVSCWPKPRNFVVLLRVRELALVW
jgi:hypothetical protein